MACAANTSPNADVRANISWAWASSTLNDGASSVSSVLPVIASNGFLNFGKPCASVKFEKLKPIEMVNANIILFIIYLLFIN